MPCAARVVVLMLSVLVSVPVLAGDDAVEITPFVGYRFGGSADDYANGENYDLESSESFGLAVDIPLSDESRLELLYSGQSTDLKSTNASGTDRFGLDIQYFQVGGLYQPGDGTVQPFVGAALGATRLDPDGDFGTETQFSFSFGGGAKVYLSEHIGLRFEGRVYGTITDGAGGAFCGSGGGCTFAFAGNVLWQGEGIAGLIIAF